MSLISKIAVVVVLASSSTKIFAMDLGRNKIKEWVKKSPVVKSALTSGVSIIGAVGIDALLSGYQSARYERACGGFGMGFNHLINKNDYLFPTLNKCVGASVGFLGGLLAAYYPDQFIDGMYVLGGVALTGATVAGLVTFALLQQQLS